MTIKIDEATGLPELPEGHYWYISAEHVQIRKHRPDGDWVRYTLNGYPSTPGDEERVEKRVVEVLDTSTFLNRLFRLREEVTENRRVNRSTKVAGGRYGTTLPDYHPKESRVPTTRANLLERCEDVYTAWRHRVDTETIYGSYPPRKFTEES